MNVSTILKTKGHSVKTAAVTATVLDIVRSLSENKIGAIVVLGEAGRIAGIVSERDIIRVLAQSGPGALDPPVAHIMTKDVITCTESDTVGEIMNMMTKGRFRHLPVVDHDRLVGIVSIGDVVKLRVSEVEMEAKALQDYIASH